MTLDEIVASLFPEGLDVATEAGGLVAGEGVLAGAPVAVIGVTNATPLGVEGALSLAAHVLAVIRAGGTRPILVLVDSGSQRMRRRDELLGLNEYLAHLAKCLLLADREGHPTVGVLFGHSAAGAFLATALATRVLVALPDAQPTVMDLPSIARVTKLPLDMLETMAKRTPVFAPSLENLVRIGAVSSVLDPKRPLDAQLAEVLAAIAADRVDRRDMLGEARTGRLRAAAIARRVCEEAERHDR